MQRRQVGRLKRGIVVERRRLGKTEGTGQGQLPLDGGAGAGEAEDEGGR